jgi:hypothetical protein
VQLKLERKLNQGLTVAASYTWSKLWMRSTLLNPTDTAPVSELSGDNRPNRITFTGVWELPFGKGRHWGNQRGGVVNNVLGGWQLGGIYLWQAGAPLSLANDYFSGSLDSLKTSYSTRTVNQPVFNTYGFYFHDATVGNNPTLQQSDSRIKLSNNIRTLPDYVAGFSGSPITSLDFNVMKTVDIGERVKVQVQGQCLNAANEVQFANPGSDPTKATFGIVSSQQNYPRILQFGAKVLF